MIRVGSLSLPITHGEEDIQERLSQLLRCPKEEIRYQIRKRSLDAREKENKLFVYTLDVTVPREQKVMKGIRARNIELYTPVPYRFPQGGEERLPARPVIVGSGPAGLFCGWYLAHAGYAPLILERGEDVDSRRRSVESFWKGGDLDPESNVQFGEGGAGTFSDGKLNTQVKDPFGRSHEVLKRFVKAGAPPEILYEQKPHLGTDVLHRVVKALRAQIESMGGEVRFGAKVEDLVLSQGRVAGVRLGGGEEIPAGVVVLAVGHSARDTFAMLEERGVPMRAKPFAVGVRCVHPQDLIDEALYGPTGREILGPAAYKLTHTCRGTGRGVYSFCMCPGGFVVNASSEKERLCVNGMSYSGRDSGSANAAIIVTVGPEDYPSSGPLSGLAFQRRLEEAAFREGQGRIPAQLYGDFCEGRASRGMGSIPAATKGEISPAELHRILPETVCQSLEEGLHAFSRQIPGFDGADVPLLGVESRTSSPVRIERDPSSLESPVCGLYPCGEGAGFAGGITSAAMDGMKVAEAVARRYSIQRF